VAAGIRWAVDHGAGVISFSLGVLDTPAMRDAIAYAYAHNVLIVAAAGNSGNDKSPYPSPALYPHVLAVGGTDNKDHRTSYSSYGFPIWCWRPVKASQPRRRAVATAMAAIPPSPRRRLPVSLP
jgi:subtilisin family serine protease